MLAYTYISHGKFELIDKPKPELQGPRDAIVRITLGSICTQIPLFANHLIPKKEPISRLLGICDSGGVRTHDPQLRRLLLYPTELRNQH